MKEMDSNVLSELQMRLSKLSKESKLTIDETKQWLVLPLLGALGYCPWGSEITPNFQLGSGVVADFALRIKGECIALIKCQAFGGVCEKDFMEDIENYFYKSNVKLVIYTNGNAYKFYTIDPSAVVCCYEFVLELLSDRDILELEKYSKKKIMDTIKNLNTSKIKYREACDKFLDQMFRHDAPNWFLNSLRCDAGVAEISKMDMMKCLQDAIDNCKFTCKKESDTGFGFTKKVEELRKPEESKSEEKSKLEEKSELEEKGKMKEASEPKKKRMRAKKYTATQCTGMDLTGKTIAYMTVFDERFDNPRPFEVLMNTIDKLAAEGVLTKEKVLASGMFDDEYKLVAEPYECLVARYVSSLDLYTECKYTLATIVKFIVRLLELGNVPDSMVKLAIKE